MPSTLSAAERAILRPMPRRQQLAELPPGPLFPDAVQAELPNPGTLEVIVRALSWGVNGTLMGSALLLDELRGVRNNVNRGRRLRQLFERMGGTAIKLGQQLASRVDLLPFEVCTELSGLMDKVPPFPVDYALERLEVAAGMPADELLIELDPKPIGAASVACVWQARLHTGEKVAIKVRRPDVADKFVADMAAFDIYTRVIELTGLVRPDYFTNLRTELRAMFMEELDFHAEARYQGLFRRWVKDSRFEEFDAPPIYRELCGDDVVVTGFAEGVPGPELVAAVETRDPVALAALAAMDIDPKVVAHNLVRLTWAGRSEAMFFHSDPHPGNMIIAPGGRITMLDFGACGTMSLRNSHAIDRSTVMLNKRDGEEAADASRAILMPVPHMDWPRMVDHSNGVFHKYVLALADKKAPWFERTTASVWISFLDAVREHSIPVNLDTLRTIRSSLLYDTLCFRLDEDLKISDFRKYWREREERVAREREKRQRRQGSDGPRQELLDRAERVIQVLEVARLQLELRSRSSDTVRMLLEVRKWAYALRRTVRGMAAVALLVLTSAVGRWGVMRAMSYEPPPFTDLMIKELTNPLLAAACLLVVVLTFVPVLRRLDDVD